MRDKIMTREEYMKECERLLANATYAACQATLSFELLEIATAEKDSIAEELKDYNAAVAFAQENAQELTTFLATAYGSPSFLKI
tara:strand:+ start:24944 stop:25195 length:252 start_codon:yes stop_codon:yes gene_type:complete